MTKEFGLEIEVVVDALTELYVAALAEQGQGWDV